jgi:mRNA interferase MazF
MPSSLQSSATRMPERGEIWLANLNPRRGTEPGKSRPVLIVQAQALLDEGHPSTVIVPLETNLIDEVAPLRIRVSAREDLRHDSDLLIDQLRAIDNKRLTEGPLARLDSESMRRVGQALLEVLDLTEILDSTTILDPTN